jgi:hypothetical protein
LRVEGSALGVQRFGCRVLGLGFRVQGSGFRNQGVGCRVCVKLFRTEDLGFTVQERRVNYAGFEVNG